MTPHLYSSSMEFTHCFLYKLTSIERERERENLCQFFVSHIMFSSWHFKSQIYRWLWMAKSKNLLWWFFFLVGKKAENVVNDDDDDQMIDRFDLLIVFGRRITLKLFKVFFLHCITSNGSVRNQWCHSANTGHCSSPRIQCARWNNHHHNPQNHIKLHISHTFRIFICRCHRDWFENKTIQVNSMWFSVWTHSHCSYGIMRFLHKTI